VPCFFNFVFVFRFTALSYNYLIILYFLKAENELQEIKDEYFQWHCGQLSSWMAKRVGLFSLLSGFEPRPTGWKSCMLTTDPLPTPKCMKWTYFSFKSAWGIAFETLVMWRIDINVSTNQLQQLQNITESNLIVYEELFFFQSACSQTILKNRHSINIINSFRHYPSQAKRVEKLVFSIR